MNRKNKFKGVIAGIEKMPKKPKFKLGEVVSACTKYGDIITGPIVDGPRRVYSELDSRMGGFKRGGLRISENTMNNFSVKWSWDGFLLTTECPELDMGQWVQKAHTEEYQFSGYEYAIKGPDCLYGFNEGSLKRV